jgi:hypothetical protein
MLTDFGAVFCVGAYSCTLSCVDVRIVDTVQLTHASRVHRHSVSETPPGCFFYQVVTGTQKSFFLCPPCLLTARDADGACIASAVVVWQHGGIAAQPRCVAVTLWHLETLQLQSMNHGILYMSITSSCIITIWCPLHEAHEPVNEGCHTNSFADIMINYVSQ